MASLRMARNRSYRICGQDQLDKYQPDINGCNILEKDLFFSGVFVVSIRALMSGDVMMMLDIRRVLPRVLLYILIEIVKVTMTLQINYLPGNLD